MIGNWTWIFNSQVSSCIILAAQVPKLGCNFTIANAD